MGLSADFHDFERAGGEKGGLAEADSTNFPKGLNVEKAGKDS